MRGACVRMCVCVCAHSVCALLFVVATILRCPIEKSTRDGTRTHNLLLRREAPYPLGRTSIWTANYHILAPLESCSRPRVWGRAVSRATRKNCRGLVVRGPGGACGRPLVRPAVAHAPKGVLLMKFKEVELAKHMLLHLRCSGCRGWARRLGWEEGRGEYGLPGEDSRRAAVMQCNAAALFVSEVLEAAHKQTAT